MMCRFLSIAFFCLLVACQGKQSRTEELSPHTPSKTENSNAEIPELKPQVEGYDALQKQCPDMDEATLIGILKPLSPNRPDYDYYARSHCVSHEEAKRRMALQAEWTTGETAQETRELITSIEKNESATFAGQWIQHSPTYAIAVAFTKDSKKTLARYTDNPIFVPVDMPGADKNTVERNQYRIMAMLENIDIPFSSANRDYKTGLFVVQLSVDKEDYIRELAAKGEIDLPDWVQFKTPPPLPHPIPKPMIESERLKAFPQYRHRREFDMQTQVGVPDTAGTLRIIEGCLAFETESATHNILWQKYHAPDLTDTERVGVISRYKGETVFEGEEILISGLQPGIKAQVNGNNNNPENWAKVADDTKGACPPPYVMAEGFTSAKKLKKAKQDARLKEYMDTFKMSRTEALKEVQKKDIKTAQISDLIDNLQETRRDIIAGTMGFQRDAFSAVYAGFGNENNLPPRMTIFVKGDLDKASIVPSHLLDSIALQSVPRSLADGDKDIAFLKEKLGNSAELRFNWHDGSIWIGNVTDLKPLSNLKMSMGKDWPERYRLSLNRSASNYIYFGPTSISGRYNMQKHPSYEAILDYAETKFPNKRYLEIDNAILHLFGYGLTDLAEIERLEARGFGPLTAELNYQSDSRKIKQAIFSEAIVTAEPIKIETYDPQDDSYRSTVTFRVKERIKGPLQSGRTFKLRMRSGEDDKGNHIKVDGETFLLPGFGNSFAEHKDWLLFISNRAYRMNTSLADTREPFWVKTGHALSGGPDKYTWFSEALTPAQMRERIKGMDTPKNLMAYASSMPGRIYAKCEILDGTPAEGLGEPAAADLMDVGFLTVKSHPDENGYYLGCDHEGPQSQECFIEDGGFITWLEDGQRKHIKAEGGNVSVRLVHGKGVRCDF